MTACAECGSTWFALVGGLKDGCVTTYLWPPKCNDCGAELVASP